MNDLSFVALEKNRLFKNSNISKLKIGQEIGKLKSVDGGSTLYKEGDPSDSLYIILDGEINLLKKGEDGKSQSIIFTENDFFGAKELFTKIDRCTTTISLTDAYLVELSKEEIDYLIQQDDAVALNIQRGNHDFKYESEKDSIREKINGDDMKTEKEYIYDSVSDDELKEIIDSIEHEDQSVFDNFQEFDNVIGSAEQSKERIENDEKNKYNWSSKENNNYENTMNDSFNQTDNEYMTKEQFEMIVKSLQLVNANVKHDDVFNNIVDVAVNLTNADRGTLYLVDKDSNEIWSKVLIGNEIEEIRLKIGEGIAGWVAENGEILNIEDVSKDERFEDSFDNATGYKTVNMLVYPIKDKTNEVVGVLQLLNSLKGGFTYQEEMFLNAISLNLALALENASLVEQLVNTERDSSLGKMGNFLTHELKKPILTCKRYTEHLKKKELEFDVKQVVNLLDELLDQVSGQLKSATGFTDGTTLLRRESVNVNDTLFDFANRVHGMAKSYNCKVEHELHEDAVISVDIKEFYQCYYNIIKNACEALPEGGNIVISTQKIENEIEINFNDKGIGILESDLSKVFDSLWTKNKKNNSGLGLSISKKIIEDHEGSISIASDQNSGTTVTIRIPIK